MIYFCKFGKKLLTGSDADKTDKVNIWHIKHSPDLGKEKSSTSKSKLLFSIYQ